ncbi:MAG: SDR family NAD(P)-dependent oxidoreductase [Pseudomonadota bacterium]
MTSINWTVKRAVVVGASGGLGEAFVDHLVVRPGIEQVYALSRSGVTHASGLVTSLITNYEQPETLARAADTIETDGPLDLIIVATGLLHADDGFGPEKSLRDIEADRLARAYLVNAIGPALAAKNFLPLLNREGKTVFAALSARVGSISDNRIGGWYGYRAAKSGLNQLLKTASIEHARRWRHTAIIGLHPGTVDTGLSKPFQRNVADSKLFTPEFSAGSLLSVIDGITSKDTGKVFDWAGEEVPA